MTDSSASVDSTEPVVSPIVEGPDAVISTRGASSVPRGHILDLFAAAAAEDPSYLPSVTTGVDTLGQWFDRKPSAWGRLAVATVAGQPAETVGHVAARLTKPDDDPMRRGRWELSRLVVSPARRRRGVATALVEEAARVFSGDGLWAGCVEGSASHDLFAGLGWVEVASLSFVDDPATGVALRCPSPLPLRGA